MRYLVSILLLFVAPASAEEAKHPDQWQYQESLEVPDGPIPRDRCILAIFGDELRDERGYRIEGWEPPISDRTARWFFEMRAAGKLKLEFCHSGAT